MNNPSSKIPLKKAFGYIFLSVLIISGSSFLGLIYFNHLKNDQKNDPKYIINAVVQTTPDNEALKTAYLAELLELSVDSPENLYAFNSKEALKKLLAQSAIKEARIKKIYPSSIWVDYSLRKPIAILGDYSNTMIDRDGVAFPIQPFFTPKRLPEIFLGRFDEEISEEVGSEKGFSWGIAINGKRFKLALDLLDFFNQCCSNNHTQLERIDVSKAFTLSCGQRQIVLMIEDNCEKKVNNRQIVCIYPRILRLDPDNYEQQLKRYLTLGNYLNKNSTHPSDTSQEVVFRGDAVVIDLRISDLAFINSF